MPERGGRVGAGAVQEFDPPGVAARDLRECLMLQVRALGIDDPLVLRILAEALDPLIKRDFRGVARELGVTIEEVAVAARIVSAGSSRGRAAPSAAKIPSTSSPTSTSTRSATSSTSC